MKRRDALALVIPLVLLTVTTAGPARAAASVPVSFRWSDRHLPESCTDARLEYVSSLGEVALLQCGHEPDAAWLVVGLGPEVPTEGRRLQKAPAADPAMTCTPSVVNNHGLAGGFCSKPAGQGSRWAARWDATGNVTVAKEIYSPGPKVPMSVPGMDDHGNLHVVVTVPRRTGKAWVWKADGTVTAIMPELEKPHRFAMMNDVAATGLAVGDHFTEFASRRFRRQPALWSPDVSVTVLKTGSYPDGYADIVSANGQHIVGRVDTGWDNQQGNPWRQALARLSATGEPQVFPEATTRVEDLMGVANDGTFLHGKSHQATLYTGMSGAPLQPLLRFSDGASELTVTRYDARGRIHGTVLNPTTGRRTVGWFQPEQSR